MSKTEKTVLILALVTYRYGTRPITLAGGRK